MCGGKPPKDNSAEIARQNEEARQGRITAGRGNIDNAFTQFNDDYYGGIEKDYGDFYNPQAQKQYEDTLKQLTFQLARQGILESKAGAEKVGELEGKYGDIRADIANKGKSAANSARTSVENQRNDLYGLNTSSADPTMIAGRASAAAGNLSAPQTLSPLANMFAGFINQGANAVSMEAQGFPGWKLGLPEPNYSLDKSSGSVVN